MYRENSETVLPIKKHTMVVRKKETGISGPALAAMMGKVNTTLVAGAMWVMPWKTSSLRPSELRRRCDAAFVDGTGALKALQEYIVSMSLIAGYALDRARGLLFLWDEIWDRRLGRLIQRTSEKSAHSSLRLLRLAELHVFVDGELGGSA